MTGDEFHLTRRRYRIRQVEIARRAGVSQGVVSAVECDLPQVAPATRQRVMDTLLAIKAEREKQVASVAS